MDLRLEFAGLVARSTPAWAIWVCQTVMAQMFSNKLPRQPLDAAQAVVPLDRFLAVVAMNYESPFLVRLPKQASSL